MQSSSESSPVGRGLALRGACGGGAVLSQKKASPVPNLASKSFSFNVIGEDCARECISLHTLGWLTRLEPCEGSVLVWARILTQVRHSQCCQRQQVQGNASPQNTDMQMRAGDAPGGAGFAEHLAAL